jgi:hypothetical protein
MSTWQRPGWLFGAFVSVALLWPANARADDVAFDGPVLWTEQGTSLVFDQADRCELDVEALSVTQELYQATPHTDEARAALDARLLQIGELAGFGPDPAQRSVSRAFLRTMLTTRVLLTLNYGVRGGQEGVGCMARWLESEGFRRIDANEAETIRAHSAD